MAEETTIAKLRNELTPHYGLPQMIMALADIPDDKREEMIDIITRTALQATQNKDRIDFLLSEIEKELEVKTNQSKNDKTN